MKDDQRSITLVHRFLGIVVIISCWALAAYLAATASAVLVLGAERIHEVLGDALYNTFFASAGGDQVFCAGWIFLALTMFVIGVSGTISLRRTGRRVVSFTFLASGAILLLAHPVPNDMVFGRLGNTRLHREYDRIQRLNLASRTPAEVESLLGAPHQMITIDGRTNWHYHAGPWFAWNLDFIVVTFELGVVSSVWIDYF